MDITPQDTTQPITDDQELAKALAGVLPDEPAAASAPIDLSALSPTSDATATAPSEPLETPAAEEPAPVAPVPQPVAPPAPATPPVDSGLESIKKDALNELRPLVDKVSLPAEEKFDIYLMLLRSTDDSSLIGPAHTAAQGIADEKRKAEALLEIIKEIDYLSRKDQPAA